MNPATLRRLASEHSSLHTSPLPPHYLLPPASDSSAIQDDLSQVLMLLAGPQGTPYSAGLWKLHLKLPEDYPRSPPKAFFRTRIWHPNVEESTGSICVDTLKRDWNPKLTLRDVFVTISCLLIQPNPDSALNAAAGQLLQDDYDAFARQAKLMTSIHAPVPRHLKTAVLEAKGRGEEAGMEIKEDKAEQKGAGRRSASGKVMMKKRPQAATAQLGQGTVTSAPDISERERPGQPLSLNQIDEHDSSDEDDEASASKENNPSLSPSPVAFCPPSPRKHVLGKRPLSDLPTPIDPEEYGLNENIESNNIELSSTDECNANAMQANPSADGPRKSPKLVMRSKGINASGRIRNDLAEGKEAAITLTAEGPSHEPIAIFDESKENAVNPAVTAQTTCNPDKKSAKLLLHPAKPAANRKVSGASTGKGAKPRVGLRRL
ncbi:UBC-like protein [Xylona heveae TC161]|uniref:UBC-like protein n=1 Tax=Xylona heveae (strain CBS 132557 / TC161) TaxID=1328760 RepID=A0A165JPH0_XYLHT|nr:UBC-like protein [Xylona heveae TC161]KZF26481.1 UBC-like protein [Xylona heveae TC161]